MAAEIAVSCIYKTARTPLTRNELIAYLPLKASSAFMFFLVQSAHLARPTTTDAASALTTASASRRAQTPSTPSALGAAMPVGC
jgi:hypothetical protein